MARKTSKPAPPPTPAVEPKPPKFSEFVGRALDAFSKQVGVRDRTFTEMRECVAQNHAPRYVAEWAVEVHGAQSAVETHFKILNILMDESKFPESRDRMDVARIVSVEGLADLTRSSCNWSSSMTTNAVVACETQEASRVLIFYTQTMSYMGCFDGRMVFDGLTDELRERYQSILDAARKKS